MVQSDGTVYYSPAQASTVHVPFPLTMLSGMETVMLAAAPPSNCTEPLWFIAIDLASMAAHVIN